MHEAPNIQILSSHISDRRVNGMPTKHLQAHQQQHLRKDTSRDSMSVGLLPAKGKLHTTAKVDLVRLETLRKSLTMPIPQTVVAKSCELARTGPHNEEE